MDFTAYPSHVVLFLVVCSTRCAVWIEIYDAIQLELILKNDAVSDQIAIQCIEYDLFGIWKGYNKKIKEKYY